MKDNEALLDFNDDIPNALDTRIGGDHYNTQGLQPFEIAYANFGYYAIQHSVYVKVLKYLNRNKGTHREDVEKAIHCLQIQLQFLDQHEAEQEK